MDKVSVIIPTYNAEPFILRCLDAVLSQTYKNIEIIVVDDGSSDETVKLLRDYDEKVTLIQNIDNHGPAYCRTVGLYESRGTYVTFLDSDDFWHECFVERTVAFLEAHPEAVAVSTSFTSIDLSGRSVRKPELSPEDQLFYNDSGRICPSFFDFWMRYFCILTGSVMMRADKVRQTGGQRSELRLTEDLEFWAYLSTFGKWGFIPQALFVTDPGVLPPLERLRKIKRRYDFFAGLHINEWSRRIDSRGNGGQAQTPDGIISHIKTSIVIANAYTLRYKESYQLVGLWGSELESGLGSVLRLGYKFGKPIWPLVCIALRVREIVKTYVSYLLRVARRSSH